jgi:diguanylate cyclase (GGDEF)-like protein
MRGGRRALISHEVGMMLANEAQARVEPENKPESILSRLSQQLAALERRDFELWLIVVGAGILVGTGLVTILLPSAILREGTVHFEISVSRELFLGLITLLVLFNTYMISSRLKLRRIRGEVITTAIHSELLRLQSFSDPLTEVYNRRLLDDMMRQYTRRAERLKKPLSFLLIDVDDFRTINSRFGHTIGDFVLLEVATILKSAVRGSDAVIRYGGDEFLIILADAPLEDTEVVMGRIERYVQDWNQSGHLKDFELGLSVGASQWTAGKTADQIMNEADQNMYAAKARGKEGRPSSAA